MHNTTFAFLSNLRINPSRLGYTEKEQILYYILACLLHHKTRNVWEVQLINHYTHAVKLKKFWETTLYQIQNLIKKKKNYKALGFLPNLSCKALQNKQMRWAPSGLHKRQHLKVHKERVTPQWQHKEMGDRTKQQLPSSQAEIYNR